MNVVEKNKNCLFLIIKSHEFINNMDKIMSYLKIFLLQNLRKFRIIKFLFYLKKVS